MIAFCVVDKCQFDCKKGKRGNQNEGKVPLLKSRLEPGLDHPSKHVFACLCIICMLVRALYFGSLSDAKSLVSCKVRLETRLVF